MSSTLTHTRSVETEQPPERARRPSWQRLSGLVVLVLVALVPVAVHYDVDTVVVYTVQQRLNQSATSPECTSTSWIVMPLAQSSDASEPTFVLRIIEDPCWSVVHGRGTAPEGELQARYERLVASEEWTLQDTSDELQSLLVSTDLDEDDVRGEVARLTGTPELGEYQEWAATRDINVGSQA